jgi:hypothetical protein
MELLKHEVYTQAIENTYTVQHPKKGVMVYKEWIDSSNGKCLDFTLMSKGGFNIDNPALIEEVQEFIDNLAL